MNENAQHNNTRFSLCGCVCVCVFMPYRLSIQTSCFMESVILLTAAELAELWLHLLAGLHQRGVSSLKTQKMCLRSACTENVSQILLSWALKQI